MSELPRHDSKPHTSTHFDPESGQTHFIRADNVADALRLELEKAVRDYEAADRIAFEITALDGPWVRLDVRYEGRWSADDWSGLPTDISKAFQGLPHGYWEIREEGANEEGTRFWFVARHDHGPLI